MKNKISLGHHSKLKSTLSNCGHEKIEGLCDSYDEIYYRGNGGVLARVRSLDKAKEELHPVDELSCGDNDVTISTFAKIRVLFLKMAKDVAGM